MDKIKNQLASIVTLIGLIGAIGAGFVKYGEINEKINSMSVVDTSGLEKQQVINVEKIKAFEQNINTNSFSINDNRNAVDELQKSTNKLNSELEKEIKEKITYETSKTYQTGKLEIKGKGLESQESWTIEGEALVTDVPITFLGFVNRITGEIEEEGHPINGESIKNKILIFPKGSGSTVAPYVLLGLFYNGNGPKAIINTNLDQQTIPACSILGVPYAHSFEDNPCLAVNNGDKIKLKLEQGNVKLECLERG